MLFNAFCTPTVYGCATCDTATCADLYNACLCVCVCVCVCTVMANNKAAMDPAGARRLGNASIGVSVAGIAVTIIVIIIIVAVNVTAAAAAAGGGRGGCNYTYYGQCYRHRDYVGSYGHCSGLRSSEGYCYYN